ncbi:MULTISPECIES: VOC family protein [unclassified Gordonia (in: high G+C Gram-positive bacteria)]|uniref:VOC family protein n=1 Tax=unclassified Gordonia (in: high G+C Gram-positive bacteria) TaxID=2657482 RepID=UPI00080DAD7F|nr:MULTISPECIES: glyoxalase/bleomycin resistance/dioxygenase family protein [unclassified Gordonia (in: high G+C Gram-positive bacteria)]MDT0222477.1 glyoxalase/bleomycin resistance/dioxygenase family protein [Gordonia sp. AC31]OCH81954.1 glyoxalase [Gordonia sp. UCD-TK1]OCW87123.1 glyoxalase [Nocardia farcinica]
MRVLKTYARIFVADLDESLPLYETIVGASADLRFTFEKAELAAVGNFLLIAGADDDVEAYRSTVGPVIVDDLDALISQVSGEAGAEVIGESESTTGRFAYLRHTDGAVLEYVQWSREVAEAVLGTPKAGPPLG